MSPYRALFADVRALPAPAWVLFAGTFVNRFGSFVLVFLVFYLRERGFDPVEAGLALSAYGAGSLAAAVVGGLIADRIGRRRTIAASMAGSAAAMLALSQARSLGAVVVLIALAGVAAESYRPASHALLADLIPEGRRLTGFALYRLAINAGFAAGPAAAGFLAGHSFTWLFVGDAVTSLVFGAVALAALPEGTRSRAVDERRGEATRTILRDGPFLRLLGVTFLGAIVYMQSQSTFALHVADAGHSTAVYGLLISLNGVLIMVFELALTTVTGRFPARRMMALGYVLIGIGLALTGLADTLPLLALTVVIWTFGEIVEGPIAPSYLADLAPERLRGRYAGARSFTFALALIVSPTLGTALYEWRPGVLWVSCLVVSVAAAALILPGPERSVEPVPAARPAPEPEAP